MKKKSVSQGAPPQKRQKKIRPSPGDESSLLDQVRTGRDRSQQLARQLMQAQELERRKLARELHDEVGQALTAVRLNLQALESKLPARTRPALAESLAIVDTALQQVRSLSLDLRPAILDDLGLTAALRWYLDRQAQRAGIAMEFHNEAAAVSRSILRDTTCFRVAQEAITNVLRHARARRVVVRIIQEQDALHLAIEDDGMGFDPGEARLKGIAGASLGLLSMEERVNLSGGRLEIASAPGRGTAIHAWLPMGEQPAVERRSERRKLR
jgi:signal transduction histidine kinase